MIPILSRTDLPDSARAKVARRPIDRRDRSEFIKAAGGNWVALDETRPLAFFAGVWLPLDVEHPVRLRTTGKNAEVGKVHPKMPVILTKPDELEHWLTAPATEPLQLERPLADSALIQI